MDGNRGRNAHRDTAVVTQLGWLKHRPVIVKRRKCLIFMASNLQPEMGAGSFSRLLRIR